jgi:hypothetical protein
MAAKEPFGGLRALSPSAGSEPWARRNGSKNAKKDEAGVEGAERIKVNQSDQSKIWRIWLVLRQAQDLATRRHAGTKGFHVGARASGAGVKVIKVNQSDQSIRGISKGWEINREWTQMDANAG